jgi:predicted nucleic acid-binding protein
MAIVDTHSPLVVCDAGPLIHLDELGCVDLLRDFTNLLIPDAVWREVGRHRPFLLNDPKWKSSYRSVPSISDAELDVLSSVFMLHRGETEALQLARSRQGAWLLTDDTAARLAAQSLEIRAHGTIGIVIRAIRRNLLSRDEVIQILESIPHCSTLFIKQTLLDSIIEEVRSNVKSGS